MRSFSVGLESRMTIKKSRRALVVTGAGASLDFGIPGTAELTGKIEAQVLADKFSRCCGADSAYKENVSLARGELRFTGGDLRLR